MIKDSPEYIQYIKNEYERIQNPEYERIQNPKIDNRPFYCFFIYGNEGLEYFQVFRSEQEMSPHQLNMLQLRCRFNAARDLKLYSFKSDIPINEKYINKKFLKKEGVIEVGF